MTSNQTLLAIGAKPRLSQKVSVTRQLLGKVDQKKRRLDGGDNGDRIAGDCVRRRRRARVARGRPARP